MAVCHSFLLSNCSGGHHFVCGGCCRCEFFSSSLFYFSGKPIQELFHLLPFRFPVIGTIGLYDSSVSLHFQGIKRIVPPFSLPQEEDKTFSRFHAFHIPVGSPYAVVLDPSFPGDL